MSIKPEWDGTTTGSGARVKPSTRDVYEGILPDYQAIPRGTATADQGIAFLTSKRFYDPTYRHSMVLENPVIAMNLAVAVGERVKAGIERNRYIDALNAHPVVPALEQFAPKEAAYYSQVRLNMAAGTVDPDRAAWQNQAWGPFRKLLADRKAAGQPLTDDEKLLEVRKLYEHPTRAPLANGSRYDAVDVLAALADNLPADKAPTFVRECIYSAPELALLRADTPQTAKYFEKFLGHKFGVTPAAAPVVSGGTPVPPAA